MKTKAYFCRDCSSLNLQLQKPFFPSKLETKVLFPLITFLVLVFNFVCFLFSTKMFFFLSIFYHAQRPSASYGMAVCFRSQTWKVGKVTDWTCMEARLLFWFRIRATSFLIANPISSQKPHSCVLCGDVQEVQIPGSFIWIVLWEYYRAFRRFGRAKIANGGLVLGLSQFSLLPYKMMLNSKVVKIDSKIILSLL